MMPTGKHNLRFNCVMCRRAVGLRGEQCGNCCRIGQEGFWAITGRNHEEICKTLMKYRRNPDFAENNTAFEQDIDLVFTCLQGARGLIMRDENRQRPSNINMVLCRRCGWVQIRDHVCVMNQPIKLPPDAYGITESPVYADLCRLAREISCARRPPEANRHFGQMLKYMEAMKQVIIEHSDVNLDDAIEIHIVPDYRGLIN